MNQKSKLHKTCLDCQNLLEEYVVGELDSSTESKIVSHLKTCNTCQHELRLAQAINTELRDLPKPQTPPDILTEVTAYVKSHPAKRGWLHRFLNIFTSWDHPRTVILRFSTLACLVGIILFGVHQNHKKVIAEQAMNDFNYAVSKIQYAFNKTGIGVNDSFASLKINEASRRAFRSTTTATSNVATAIDRSLGILDKLTGNVSNSTNPQNSDSSLQPTGMQ